MPVRNKTYSLISAAGGASTNPIPSNPQRVSLVIQNTGGNPGQVRFAEPNQSVGGDFSFIAGAREKWDQSDTCPRESVNLASVLGTTWCIMEGTLEGGQ